MLVVIELWYKKILDPKLGCCHFFLNGKGSQKNIAMKRVDKSHFFSRNLTVELMHL